MTPAFVVLCRDKAKHVRMACQSALDQTYPSHIIFSNQGSVDGTAEIAREMAWTYKGHHKVDFVECPEVEKKGMPGCNAHLDWLFKNVEEELIVVHPADDWAHPDRAGRCVEAFEQTKADYVCTGMEFFDPIKKEIAYNAHPNETKMVTSREILEDQVGGSTAWSIRKSFYNRIGDVPPIVCNDVYLPFLATLTNGCYYIHEKLQTYIQHYDEHNTGLGGQMRAATTDEKKQQIEEIQQFQLSATWYALIEKMIEMKIGAENDTCGLIGALAFHQARCWAIARTKLTERRWSPIPFPA